MLAERISKRTLLREWVSGLLELDDLSTSGEIGAEVIPFLSSQGSVALIGGAIRDMARTGRRGLASDLDFVIYDGSRDAFVSAMAAAGGLPNRFGGYALTCFKYKIDVWHIDDTWARTAGYVSVREPADLLKCTFFDWDSVVFEVGSRRLHLPSDYFDRLALNIMDVRLEENPNPRGSLVRALRRAALWHVRFGPRLTAFTLRHINDHSWDELVALDRQAFGSPVLAGVDREALLRQLEDRAPSPVGEVTLPVPPASES